MYAWEAVSPNGAAAFAPRDGAGALVLHDSLWLLGGWNWDDAVHFVGHPDPTPPWRPMPFHR